ncbi:MAG: zf-HC2 domain-containing protein [Phycisphaerales bacterium]
MAYLTCKELLGFMDDYVAGELDAGVLERFEEHLAVCPHCREYLSEYRTSIELAGRLRSCPPEAPAPGSVPQRLLDAVRDALSSRGSK